MKDFTLQAYEQLLLTLGIQGYDFQTLETFVQERRSEKVVILRHDVDKKPENALNMALIENDLGISSSYYFRATESVFDGGIIKKIISLNHEIGYHYENMDSCSGDVDKAHTEFKEKLDSFNSLYPIKTICMHGSPLSKWDNRALWNNFDYKEYGIIAEPYFDLDFDQVLYITDTGRRWDGHHIAVRDKGSGSLVNAFSGNSIQTTVRLRNTWDIIDAGNKGSLPKKIMLNAHPQRWNDRFGPWLYELVFQNLKNIVKRAVVRLK